METVAVQWEGQTVRAVVPPVIASWDVELSLPTVRRTEQAAAAVLAADSVAPGTPETAARLLLRSEGLASSAIEGLRVPIADVALAEVVGQRGGTGLGGERTEVIDPTAAWVADNLAVVADALAYDGPLNEAVLLDWHRRLMVHSPTIEPRHVGAWRDTLGWVGGGTPRLAVHVAPPADLVPTAMEDLLRFAARDDLDPVTHAAVLHAQFETIHPFADGNGRIGRVMVGWVLARRLRVEVPPPVSLQMARDVGGYQAGLTLYRQGMHDAWVAWFADAVRGAAEGVAEVLADVIVLLRGWHSDIADLRADATAHRIIDLLTAQPVLSAASAAAALGSSRRAAAGGLAELARRGIVTSAAPRQSGRGRPEQWWVASDLLALVGH